MLLRGLSILALLAACTQGSGCAAGTGVAQDGGDARRRAGDQRPAAASPSGTAKQAEQPPVPVAQERTAEAPVIIAKPVPPKPVREGQAPIIYLVPADGQLRIVDRTANREIAAAPADDRSILRIDDLTGVTLGKQTLIKGPLPPGHEYEVFLSTGSENVVRHGVSTPGR